MQFCKDCGTALNLFGNKEREFCSSCIQQKKKHELPTKPQPPAPKSPVGKDNVTLLDDATLSYENNKLILRSKEGWELWSGPGTTTTPLKQILSRAKRIYEIRLRRSKN